MNLGIPFMDLRLVHDFVRGTVVWLGFGVPSPPKIASDAAEGGNDKRNGVDFRGWRVVCWDVRSNSFRSHIQLL